MVCEAGISTDELEVRVLTLLSEAEKLMDERW